MKSIDIAGIIPAVALPVTEDYKIDEPTLRRYARWVLGHGVKAISVNGHGGEGPYLFPEERVRVLEIWADEVRGRVPIVAGVPAVFTDEAVRLAKDAQKAGADALLVFQLPIYGGGPLPAEIPYNYHKALADETGMPQIFFQGSASRGETQFSVEMFHRLIEIPEVVGIKEGSFDCARYLETVRILKAAPRQITILNGNDDFIFEGFLFGGEGGLLSFSTVAISEQVEMLSLVKRGEILKAKAIWDRLRPLEAVIFGAPFRNYVVRTKETLVQLGVFQRSTSRRPYLPVTAAEREQIRRALAKAGVRPAEAPSAV